MVTPQTPRLGVAGIPIQLTASEVEFGFGKSATMAGSSCLAMGTAERMVCSTDDGAAGADESAGPAPSVKPKDRYWIRLPPAPPPSI